MTYRNHIDKHRPSSTSGSAVLSGDASRVTDTPGTHRYTITRNQHLTPAAHTEAFPGSQATASFRRTGSVWCLRLSGDIRTSIRTPDQAADAYRNFVYFSMPLSGSASGVHAGHSFRLHPGEAVALRNDRPYELHAMSRPIDAVNIAIPAERLRIWDVDVSHLVAKPWQLSTAATRARDFIAAVCVDESSDAAVDISGLDDILLRMALLVVSCREDFSHPPTRVVDIRKSVLDIIESRASDPNLTCEAIAAGLHASTRTIHRAFEGTGATVSGLIVNQRLEGAAAELALGPRDRTIAAIARSNGFRGADQLTRNFKRRYGMNPTDYRTRHALTEPLNPA